MARYFVQRDSLVLTRHERELSADLRAAAPCVSMDIRDEQAVRRALRELTPDVVIHAAGNKDVRYCEKNPGEALATNETGARNVARACREVGARMIYISTDLVFSCTRGGYRETDTPLPSQVYGKSKLLGEQAVMEELPDAVICRSGGIYGRSSPLLLWLSAELRAERIVECFVDVFNTPTYAENLAEMLDYIVRNSLVGVFHTVGSQRVSRYQLFEIYASECGFDTRGLVPRAAGARKRVLMLTDDASLSIEWTRTRVRVPFDDVTEGMRRLKLTGGV